MRKNFLLLCVVFISFYSLFFTLPKPAFAQAVVTCTNYCCPDPNGRAGDEICREGTAMTFSCSQQAAMCAGTDGNPHPPNVSDPKAWTFYYNPTCTAVHWSSCGDEGVVTSTTCDWQDIDCSAVDRCDTGYNRGSDYKVYAGQCNASAYNGSDPQTACTTGGWYKSCCTGNETSPTSPLGRCNVTPYVRTCESGSATLPEVITCPVPDCSDEPPSCTDCAYKSGMENTCSAGNATGTNCTYKKYNGSTNCRESSAPNQPCTKLCDPNSSLPNH